MEQKYFTPQEASLTLPLVKKIVDDILGIGQSIRDASKEAGQSPEENPQVIELMGQLETLFEELESIGCYYKDWNFSMGLVDFPSTIEGNEVFLCWRSDEDRLLYYHEVDEGFPGRKRIPQELL